MSETRLPLNAPRPVLEIVLTRFENDALGLQFMGARVEYPDVHRMLEQAMERVAVELREGHTVRELFP